MSGRLYNPNETKLAELQRKKLERRITFKQSGDTVMQRDVSGGLVQQISGLPAELKKSEGLTLDQIDARDVKIETQVKKGCLVPKARITNGMIRLVMSPSTRVGLVKELLTLAVEARRRLRHPQNQVHADLIPGIAWGKLESRSGRRFPGTTAEGSGLCLVVTLAGKPAVTVYMSELRPEPKADSGPLVTL